MNEIDDQFISRRRGRPAKIIINFWKLNNSEKIKYLIKIIIKYKNKILFISGIILFLILIPTYIKYLLSDNNFIYGEYIENILHNNNIKFSPDRRLIIQDIMESIPEGDPVTGNYSSDFGWRKNMDKSWDEFHPGIDIFCNEGTPVKATASGIVIMATFYGGYGLLVRIAHRYGFETVYAHCSRLAVQVGQSVYRGQVIAYSGRTGFVTGPHVHYEIRYSKPITKEEIRSFMRR